MHKCKCKRGCKAEVKSRTRLYARGHSPDSHSEKRNKKAGKAIKQKYARGEVKPRSVIWRHTPESKRKISKARKGKFTAAMREAVNNRSFSPEALKSICKKAKARIGKFHRSEETKQLMSRKMKKIRAKKHWSSWAKGTKLPYSAWNKGLTKKTDKRVAAYGKKLQGRQTHTGSRKFDYARGRKKIWMRSSWEVAYAKWLDKRKVKWLYESRAFYVGESKRYNGATYCPDFYLVTARRYVEIKGAYLFGARAKLNRFRKLYPKKRFSVLEQDWLQKKKVLVYKEGSLVKA
jgi:hypothetical protein